MSEFERTRSAVPPFVPSARPDAFVPDEDLEAPAFTREGLPAGFRMRHDAHYVDQLTSRTIGPQVRLIPIGDIDVAKPGEARDLAALVKSIQKFGVLQPLLVRPRAGRFELIAGARRLAAAAVAALTEVPCMVHQVDDLRARALAEAENLRGGEEIQAPAAPPAIAPGDHAGTAIAARGGTSGTGPELRRDRVVPAPAGRARHGAARSRGARSGTHRGASRRPARAGPAPARAGSHALRDERVARVRVRSGRRRIPSRAPAVRRVDDDRAGRRRASRARRSRVARGGAVGRARRDAGARADGAERLAHGENLVIGVRLVGGAADRTKRRHGSRMGDRPLLRHRMDRPSRRVSGGHRAGRRAPRGGTAPRRPRDRGRRSQRLQAGAGACRRRNTPRTTRLWALGSGLQQCA